MSELDSLRADMRERSADDESLTPHATISQLIAERDAARALCADTERVADDAMKMATAARASEARLAEALRELSVFFRSDPQMERGNWHFAPSRGERVESAIMQARAAFSATDTLDWLERQRRKAQVTILRQLADDDDEFVSRLMSPRWAAQALRDRAAELEGGRG